MRWIWRVLSLVVAVGGTGASAFGQGTPSGPTIVYFGVTRADDTLVPPSMTDAHGAPIVERAFGSGFSLVVEAKAGPSGRPVGPVTFDPEGCPDLQVQTSLPLGNGSAVVCDTVPPNDGGVPATNPVDLYGSPVQCDALNDLGCRFIDGGGAYEGRSCDKGCVLFSSGEQHCVASDAQVQFCGFIAQAALFPVGDTVVTARVRDVDGNLGPAAQVVVRILPPPTPVPTKSVETEDDGCRVSPGGGTGGTLAVWLLGPALLLCWRRRSQQD